MRWQMCDNKEGSFTSPFVEMAEKAPRPPHICQDCPVALVSRALADGKLSKIQGSQIQGCTCKARYVSLTAPLPRLHPASPRVRRCKCLSSNDARAAGHKPASAVRLGAPVSSRYSPARHSRRDRRLAADARQAGPTRRGQRLGVPGRYLPRAHRRARNAHQDS